MYSLRRQGPLPRARLLLSQARRLRPRMVRFGRQGEDHAERVVHLLQQAV